MIRFGLNVMLRAFRLIVVVFATAACVFSASVKQAKTATSTAAKTALNRSASNKTASKTSKAKAGVKTVKYVRGKNGKRRVVAKAPAYQLHPDPERYQQIQQALTDRGYFKGEVNGQWGDDSEDALRRFQIDQKLFDDDGHLTALTLIGLGLGPKHDHDMSAPATPAGNKPSPAPLDSPAAAKATSPPTGNGQN